MMIAEALTAMAALVAVLTVAAGYLLFRMQPAAIGRPVPVLRLHAEDWQPNAAERRHGERLLVSATASLETLDGAEQSLEVDILDLGQGGMRITQTERLEPDTAVQVRLDGRDVLLGSVVYCRRLDDRYHAGIRLEKRIDAKFLERISNQRAR